jgi:hypothetical protein
MMISEGRSNSEILEDSVSGELAAGCGVAGKQGIFIAVLMMEYTMSSKDGEHRQDILSSARLTFRTDVFLFTAYH